MYKYDKFDAQLVRERAIQFRGQVERFLAGDIREDEFKQLRLRNGLYLQRHAYMLRVAIPYGLLSSTQMRMLATIAREFDRGYGHFTTRQNIQYNWPNLEDVPDILDLLASVEMHAIQTSGNAIRNITSDHLAGVSADELEDPRPYCEILRQWSSLHPEFNWLPRKFKIAVTAAEEDRTAMLFHDIGLRIVRNEQGERGVEVYVGGGMGRTPFIGSLIEKFLPIKYLLSYLEAILRIYNLEGRRDNIYKARIKILVNALGIERFKEKVEAEWQHLKDSKDLWLTDEEIKHMQAQFNQSGYQALQNNPDSLNRKLSTDNVFKRWYESNTQPHKINGYRVVTISLKPPDIAPGDATDGQMECIADLADQYSFGEVRTTHDQNLVLADVRQQDLYKLWRQLEAENLATANIGALTDMICCPGLDFCSLANAGSIDVAKQINDKFDNVDRLNEIGKVQLKMSGCMNACGHHHAGHIGILGVDKRGEEWYQITLGGSTGNDNQPAVGDRLGAAIAKDEVANVISDLLVVYEKQKHANEEFIQAYRRIGIAPFKEKIYGTGRSKTRK